ncbi:hypothetical protein MRX96_036118 [Rhipicephalus microplus]
MSTLVPRKTDGRALLSRKTNTARRKRLAGSPCRLAATRPALFVSRVQTRDPGGLHPPAAEKVAVRQQPGQLGTGKKKNEKGGKRENETVSLS